MSLTDTTQMAINALFDFVKDNYPNTAKGSGWIEYYKMPDKVDVNFAQYHGIKDFAVTVAYSDENPEDQDLGGSVIRYNVIAVVNLYRRYIPDPDPEFTLELWHFRQFIEKIIRSNPFGLESTGIAYMRLTGINPMANVKEVIDPMIKSAKDVYVTQIYVNMVYYLDVTRIS